MSWLHAHFSRDLAIHAIFSFDPEDEWPIGGSTSRTAMSSSTERYSDSETRTERPCAANVMQNRSNLVLVEQRRPRVEAQRRRANHLPLAVLAEHGVLSTCSVDGDAQIWSATARSKTSSRCRN